MKKIDRKIAMQLSDPPLFKTIINLKARSEILEEFLSHPITKKHMPIKKRLKKRKY